eukprot:CAMPEP_0204640944 /NCGR_PEP_ID=MMETSP0717-20131115/49453_1 /ASSEMBLY_ACC=CAM_ASM_000666 /TAXON_ID=230516 /ORGANISM="Chaetoceros curvisetus" /LENGTH=307 /DNA_ID=CAMNT_0051661495 /DNA_START=152 /DNA_END=1072 /DNA_ORIENTATION=+
MKVNKLHTAGALSALFVLFALTPGSHALETSSAIAESVLADQEGANAASIETTADAANTSDPILLGRRLDRHGIEKILRTAGKNMGGENVENKSLLLSEPSSSSATDKDHDKEAMTHANAGRATTKTQGGIDLNDDPSSRVHRLLYDSSWDGWKSIMPNMAPSVCTNGIELVYCNTYANGDELMWSHNYQGFLFNKKAPSLCLSYAIEEDTNMYKPIFQNCDNSNYSLVWTRTTSGQILNTETQKVLVKENCSVAIGNLVLRDEDDAQIDDGCDLWSVVGPNEHDPQDIGSDFFRAPVYETITSRFD